MLTDKIYIVKANGEKEAFIAEKLEQSLARAGASGTVTSSIVTHIEKELQEGMSTSQIYKHAFFLLEKAEKPTAYRYSLKRAVMDLGPSGFPFEDFVGALFKEKGFNVKTDQMVNGHCVEHEVDVVAWNENKLIMCEAKFHNELGVKSDLKVALYVKARMDDLMGATFNFGKNRKLDEGWLITNTKFSTSAIAYGACQNLTMIGWNYPSKGNLQEMIEDSGLHPLTCLSSLSNTNKSLLLKQGIVLCKALAADPTILTNIGLDSETVTKILDEIRVL
ncbi:restriction endonuclease [Candidatus Parcubacteria bacterium]|nr:restriction endonuclease [Candidatus Parcubacteria bacterium]